MILAQATIDPRSLTNLEQALRLTVQMKGKSAEAVVNKAGQYLASFATAKVPQKAKAITAAQIWDLMRTKVSGEKMSRRFIRVKGRRRKVKREAKQQNEWRNTLAAVLVATINYSAARKGLTKRWVRLMAKLNQKKDGTEKAKTAAAFYRVVEQFAKKRKASAGYHRAGMAVAIKTFRANRAALQGAKEFRFFRQPPGDATAARTENQRTIADMGNHARAIEAIAPTAFADSEPEVASLFGKWLAEDQAAAAKKAGFSTR